jgi:hypothetical protein
MTISMANVLALLSQNSMRFVETILSRCNLAALPPDCSPGQSRVREKEFPWRKSSPEEMWFGSLRFQFESVSGKITGKGVE